MMIQNFNKRQVHIPAHDPKSKLGLSKPRYPQKERGVCLIVGTHPCVHEDVEEALLIYPNADICAVNEATQLMPADHLATCHSEKIDLFYSMHFAAWAEEGEDIESPIVHVRDLKEANTKIDCFRWDINIGGGSAMFAAGVMLAIGYDLVILCGCPIDGGGGYAIPTHEGTMYDPRLGNMDADNSMVRSWHLSIEHFKDNQPEQAEKIRSMSGFTKTVFGGI